MGSKSVIAYTLNGIATTILHADEGAGKAIISASADNQDPLTATVTIQAATTVNVAQTVGMLETGTPLTGILLAILLVTAGLILPRRKK